MILDFLPIGVRESVGNLKIDKLFNVRLRIDSPITCLYNNKIQYLSRSGATTNRKNSIICTKEDIESIILTVTDKSIYAFNNQIKNGYITTKNGVRIGLAGECVVDDYCNVVTIKNVNSLNIRIPHLVMGCSKNLLNKINGFKLLSNLLIIAPPGGGKTTMLKDICLNFNRLKGVSVLVVDERKEFCDVCGENIDVIKNCDKKYAFKYAIRSLSPTIIITDELASKGDWECVYDAINNGIKVCASVHASSLNEIKNNRDFIKMFDYYALMGDINQVGVIKNVFNKDFDVVV